MRLVGCVINYNIAIAIGKWIVFTNDVDQFFKELALEKGEQQQQRSLCLPVF